MVWLWLYGTATVTAYCGPTIDSHGLATREVWSPTARENAQAISYGETPFARTVYTAVSSGCILVVGLLFGTARA